VLPKEMLAGVVEDAGGSEDDHLLDSVVLDGMADLIASTAPGD
jgi:hypothetical protein